MRTRQHGPSISLAPRTSVLEHGVFRTTRQHGLSISLAPCPMPVHSRARGFPTRVRRVILGAPSLGRGDDLVGYPHRAQISPFELFELVLLSKLYTVPCRAIRGSNISVNSTLPHSIIIIVIIIAIVEVLSSLLSSLLLLLLLLVSLLLLSVLLLSSL